MIRWEEMLLFLSRFTERAWFRNAFLSPLTNVHGCTSLFCFNEAMCATHYSLQPKMLGHHLTCTKRPKGQGFAQFGMRGENPKKWHTSFKDLRGPIKLLFSEGGGSKWSTKSWLAGTIDLVLPRKIGPFLEAGLRG